ncbi:MAG TPA: methyltransferase domain-containing protein [Candidatus Hydrogenedentes bacterium]|nr:methyltransferase domain-containing protein [Candidatus Hydrogenedentota bacterium]HRT19298.1 methyltransferase domain-containing protein [Candidatus Hydrogenedentota bacterium]HRT63378.1 methyltransferase domain-containing protein [Candidatus Hydrogenedentota bacterium]
MTSHSSSGSHRAHRGEGFVSRTSGWLWIIGLSLYVAFVSYVGWRHMGEKISGLHVPSLTAMAAAYLFALWLRAVKWRFAIGPGRQSTGLYFVSKAGGALSPGRVGELAPLLLPGHRDARLAAWIILDRFLEGGATILLGLAGLLVFKISNVRMTWLFGGSLIVLVVAPMMILRRRAFFASAAQRIRRPALAHRALSLAETVSREMAGLDRVIPWAAAISLAATGMDLVVGKQLYRCFGHDVPFALLAIAQCAHALASVTPFTPNATGVPYVVAGGILYAWGGLPPETIAAAIGVNAVVVGVLFWSSFGIGATGLRWRRTGRVQTQADLFDFLASETPLYAYDSESLRRLKGLVANKGRVLDVGCGDGAIGEALDAPGIVAFDISPRCAQHARNRGLDSLVADARQPWPFAENTFDTVYCVDVLHHLPGAWEAVLQEAHRVLKPGGTLAIAEPDARYAFVRWTQAPHSPIRVAPWPNEPAIYPADLESILSRLGCPWDCRPLRLDGHQMRRSVFPWWQRLLKAPFVLALAAWHGNRPNKFAIVARKPKA